MSQASPRDVARLLASSTPESALLYTGLPSSREATSLSDAALSCAVGLRLGAEVAAPGRCVCGGELDARRDHALTCNRGAARGSRHSKVNVRIRCALASAEVAATLEPVGLDLKMGSAPTVRLCCPTRVAGRWLGMRRYATRARPATFRLRRAPLARSLKRPRHRSSVNTSPFPTVWTSAPLVLRPSEPSARVLERCLMILPPAPTRAAARSTRASGSPPRFRSAMRLASWRLTRAALRRFRDS